MKNKGQAKKGTMKRLIRMLFEFYPVLLPLVLVCIVLNALISSIPAIFQQNIIAVVEQYWQTKDWAAAAPTVTRLVLILVVLYALSLAAGYAYSYGMAIITQGSLKKMREKMFNRMQDLPIKYFDSHNNGDIMMLRYANERSENGGESLARGTIIEDRFLTPRIQVTVTDPQTNTEYRVDFVWKLDDGRVIVAEYDGTQKYEDPAMTDNRSIQEVVAKERARDEGLKRAGATEIVHFTYADVIERTPLRVKLIKAGVPQVETSA